MRRLSILFLTIVLLAQPFLAWAQTSPLNVRLHDVRGPLNVQDPSGLPGLALEVDFSLLNNADGQLAADAEPSAAFLDLTSGLGFPATVKKAADPWSVVIVLDASKNVAAPRLAEPYKKAREAFASLIGTFPQGSNLAVLTFQSQPATTQAFIQDSGKVAERVRGSLIGQGDSCLNAGLFEAANLLTGATGRRAIFLLTASGDACGNRVPQDVVNLAQKNHIQIYAVGLKGYSITDAELQTFTEPTGGVYRMREQDEALFAFQDVLRIITGQFTAEVTVYPPAGPQTGVLTLELKDGTKVTSPVINFSSDREYTQPARVALRGEVRSTLTGVLFNLEYTSPQLIQTLLLQAKDPQTGNVIVQKEVSGSELVENDNVLGEGGTFMPNSKYQLVVTALGQNGNPVASLEKEFEFRPPEAQFGITKVEIPTPDKLAFTVEVASVNVTGVTTYTVWLVTREDTVTPVPGTVKSYAVGEPLVVPVQELSSGRYLVVVQALGVDGKVLLQTISEEQNYERQSALQAFIKFVSENQWAFIGMLAMCGVAVAVLGGVLWIFMPTRNVQPKAVELALPEQRRMAAPEPVSRPAEPQPAAVPPHQPKPASPQPIPKPVEARPAVAPIPQEPTMRVTPPATNAQPSLITQEPAYLNLKVAIPRTPFSIGRKEGCDLVLPLGNTSGVSSRHATISLANGQYFITDEKSTYGVFINGQRIQAGTPTLLPDNAVLSLGPQVKILFRQNY